VQVVGIEMNELEVSDAHRNAVINDIKIAALSVRR
jgi:tRNA/tmRNA/rRNA uracil-C5-methylase (TrmA/RlmC/RlmD family)